MKTYGALLVAAGVMAAQAACPNQCSGHGRCTENDKCECYKQTGTTWRQRVGYTGPDCSQRTCPLGVSFDTLTTNRGVEIEPVKLTLGKSFAGVPNTRSQASFVKAFAKGYKLGESYSFDVRVSAVTDTTTVGDAEPGDSIFYQWKLSSQDTYSAPASFIDVTANTFCSQVTPCELKNNGLINGQTETGIYIYFDDDNLPAAVDTDLLFHDGSSAATVAAGQGMEEGNIFSFSFDYQEGRHYEYGNSNHAHQQVECSGRGSCDRASGRCACFPGFNGEACQRTMCPNDCSGHGVCQDLRRFASDYQSEAGGNVAYATAYDAKKQMGCLCDDGFRGPDCSQIECPSGADPMGHYGGDGLDSTGATGNAMDCSGRGLCDYSSGTCSCFKGYFGERCEYQTNFV